MHNRQNRLTSHRGASRGTEDSNWLLSSTFILFTMDINFRLVMSQMVAPSFPIMAPMNQVRASRHRVKSHSFCLDTDPGDPCLNEPLCPNPWRPWDCWAAISSGMQATFNVKFPNWNPFKLYKGNLSSLVLTRLVYIMTVVSMSVFTCSQLSTTPYWTSKLSSTSEWSQVFMCCIFYIWNRKYNTTTYIQCNPVHEGYFKLFEVLL